MTKQRDIQLRQWLASLFDTTSINYEALAGDASVRRYFRLYVHNQSYIIMDAPPDQIDNTSFVKIAKILTTLGVHVPQIIQQNLGQGFLLITDFGDELLLNCLTSTNAGVLYQQTFDVLLKIQYGQPTALHDQLPVFDRRFMHRELNLFTDWFLQKHLGLSLSHTEKAILTNAYDTIITITLEQPYVFMHRDYHSRNLMRLPNQQIGVIDFQDALRGPITYDLVSLLKDCYIDWPRDQVELWVSNYHHQVKQYMPNCSSEQFLHWFDVMGLQRHLKVLGIFSRLKLRDNKPNHLHYSMPRILRYLDQALQHYAQLTQLRTFLQHINDQSNVE